jgi:hypothetical protein
MLKNHPALGGAKAWRSTGLWRGGPATYKVVVVNIDIEANDMRARPGVPSRTRSWTIPRRLKRLFT